MLVHSLVAVSTLFRDDNSRLVRNHRALLTTAENLLVTQIRLAVGMPDLGLACGIRSCSTSGKIHISLIEGPRTQAVANGRSSHRCKVVPLGLRAHPHVTPRVRGWPALKSRARFLSTDGGRALVIFSRSARMMHAVFARRASSVLARQVPRARMLSYTARLAEEAAPATPASPKITQIVDSIEKLTLLEASELVTELKVCDCTFALTYRHV